MSRGRKSLPSDLSQEAAAILGADSPRNVVNVVIAFPGITPHVDCPFAVDGGNTVEDCLGEVRGLVAAVSNTLESVAEKCGRNGDAIGGCVFMLEAAAAMVESVIRAWEMAEAQPEGEGDGA